MMHFKEEYGSFGAAVPMDDGLVKHTFFIDISVSYTDEYQQIFDI